MLGLGMLTLGSLFRVFSDFSAVLFWFSVLYLIWNQWEEILRPCKYAASHPMLAFVDDHCLYHLYHKPDLHK